MYIYPIPYRKDAYYYDVVKYLKLNIYKYVPWSQVYWFKVSMTVNDSRVVSQSVHSHM